MNKLHLSKWMLLAVLLCLLCVALSGCIVDPETQQQPVDTSTWKRYSEIPQQPTPTITINQPSANPNQQSWDVPSDQPSIATPSPTVVGAATIVPGLAGSATPSLDPNATATPASDILKRGSQGERVKYVQEALKRLKYFEGKADGDFGEYTENAVKEFQRQNGLTPDGVVGPATLNKLGSSTAATARPTHSPTPKVTPKPTKTPTPRPTQTPNTSNTYLTNGNSGANVTTMQKRLIDLGYLMGSASGRVCDITEQAIVAFQKRNNLDDDGIAGPGTLEKMYSNSAKKASSAVGIIGMTLKLGNEGSEVRLLQNKLKSYGFLTGSADGIYGTATETAVKEFQRANGLTADGKAGYSTIQKLFAGTVSSSSQSNATKTPKPTATIKANDKPTATPNAYIRVTAAPDGSYVTLERGTMGSLVTKLQKALKSAGYFSGECDGYYGEATENAVKRFQRDKGLVQDGKAGPATQRYLYEGAFPDKS